MTKIQTLTYEPTPRRAVSVDWSICEVIDATNLNKSLTCNIQVGAYEWNERREDTI